MICVEAVRWRTTCLRVRVYVFMCLCVRVYVCVLCQEAAKAKAHFCRGVA